MLDPLAQPDHHSTGFNLSLTSCLLSSPFLTCHVAHCAAYCKAKGYGLPWFFEGRLTSYLKDVLPTVVSKARIGYAADSDMAELTMAYALVRH
jgi:hypothetical protein